MIKITLYNGEELAVDTKIPDGAIGTQIREYLIYIQNVFGNVNEAHDNAVLRFDRAKAYYEEIEELVDEHLSSNTGKGPITSKASKGKKSKLKVNVTNREGVTTNLLEAKGLLIDAKFEAARTKSFIEEIKSAIGTARSILAWDRHEYEATS